MITEVKDSKATKVLTADERTALAKALKETEKALKVLSFQGKADQALATKRTQLRDALGQKSDSTRTPLLYRVIWASHVVGAMSKADADKQVERLKTAYPEKSSKVLYYKLESVA